MVAEMGFVEGASVQLLEDDLEQGLVAGDAGVIVDAIDENNVMVEFADIKDPTADSDILVTVVPISKLQLV